MTVRGALALCVLLAGGGGWGQQGKPSAAVPASPGPGLAGSASGQGGAAATTSRAARSAEAPGGGVVREASVGRFLREFERASEANDANVKAALYAERVDRYFLKTDVTREFVYRDVLDWLSRGRLITRFRLTVLGEEGSGEERRLLVRKQASWIAGSERKELVTRSQLVLRRVGEGWRIVGERDYKPG